MRLLLGIFSGLVTLVVMLVGMVVWRLAQGPVPLDFLTPRIEQAIHDVAPALQVRIGGTSLVWDREDEHIDVTATDVHVAGVEPGQDITVPSVALRFQLAALLEGEIQLAAVDLVEPRLKLVRQADGSVRFGIGGEGVSPAGARFGADSPLSRIESLGVRDGIVQVEDHTTQQTYQIDKFDLALQPRAEGFEVTAAAELDLTQILGAEAAKDGKARVQLEGEAQLAADVVEVKRLAVAVGQIALEGKGRVQGLGAGEPAFDVDATVPALATAAIRRYWPATAAPDARQWVVANITGGQVSNATIHVTASLPKTGDFKLDGLDGKTQYDGLSVRFLDTMPPVTGVSGTAAVTLAGGDFNVTSGRLLDIAVSQARVRLPAGAKPSIVIDAKVQGPLTSAFDVLDREPVRLRQLIGFAPRAGSFSGSVGFAFPLRDGLRYPDLGLKVSSAVSAAAVDRIAGDWNLTAGDFTLGIAGAALTIDGAGRLQDVPLRGALRDTIGARGATKLEVSGDVDVDGWRRLGFDLTPWVGGVVGVRVGLTPVSAGVLLVDASTDLGRATIALPIEAVAKPADVAGSARAKLRFDGGALSRVDGLEIAYGGNSLDANGVRQANGAWRTLNAELTVAPLQAGRSPGRATVALGPSGNFQIQSADAGALISAFGVEHGKGGTLGFVGATDPRHPGREFEGKLSVHDVVITRSPLLTKVLQLASLQGMLNLFGSQGIHFERVSANMSVRGTVLTVGEGVARGASLGLVLSGNIDFGADVVDLQGSVIPSYFGLNEGIGKVPILGTLLAGDEGKGVQSFDFTATGAVADPKVKVNTLSSITPNGFLQLLRRLE